MGFQKEDTGYLGESFACHDKPPRLLARGSYFTVIVGMGRKVLGLPWEGVGKGGWGASIRARDLLDENGRGAMGWSTLVATSCLLVPLGGIEHTTRAQLLRGRASSGLLQQVLRRAVGRGAFVPFSLL